MTVQRLRQTTIIRFLAEQLHSRRRLGPLPGIGSVSRGSPGNVRHVFSAKLRETARRDAVYERIARAEEKLVWILQD